ncbi:hypothetical protein TH61_13980 [Rufibacter sp. DG15C]|nr:hypothetical protein TH61_13980 [Rufibacter sp. DG15C]
MLAAAQLGFAQKNEKVPTLVQAERAFAASAVNGTKAAFLAVLDEKSILFRPLPVPGIAATEKGPDGGLLSWHPEYALTATSGDMGFTTGPFEFRKNPEDAKPISTGHFVSVWKKNPQGTWKLMLDIGTQHAPVSPAPLFDFTRAKDLPPSKTKAIQPNALDLLAREKAFGQFVRQHSLQKALEAFMAPEARYYLPGVAPIQGKDAILKHVKKSEELEVSPMAAEVVASQDFGYTYGTQNLQVEGQPVRKFSYARIWQKDKAGTWQIILDITNEVPST